MSSSRFTHQQQQAQQRSQTQPFLLRTTNTSQPSIIHTKRSQHSITASEDYYSLSGGSSTYSADAPNAPSTHAPNTINRYQTPPERYRTPLQSASHLPQPSQQQTSEHAIAEDQDEQQQFRKTPMRGQGKRRSSVEERQAAVAAAAAPSVPSAVRRKPVPSTVMEQQRESGISQIGLNARSSAARDLDREANAPTPDVDDTPYIHFALEQLTRDEEVRGSRRYVGAGRDSDGNYPYLTPLQVHQQQRALEPQRPAPVQHNQTASPPRMTPYQALPQEEQIEQESEQPQQPGVPTSPPPRNPSRQSQVIQPLKALPRPKGQNLFVPVLSSREYPLRFIPGTLRPLRLALFALALLAYLVCLIIAAAWSRANIGLTRYGSFGDGKYFVFRYLPILLGMLLLVWLIHLEVAVYRIAPFMAMASNNPRARAVGATLPLQPRGFLLPYFGHFKAAQPLAGVFLCICWLQLFTIPLLASCFNVHFSGAPTTGSWRWIAVQGAIWTVIALYILLLLALCGLFVWLRRCRSTGLRWDPRTLADLFVLLERSNALDGTSSAEAARLGQWHTTHRPNEVFHTFGITDKSPRSYAVGDDGRIRETLPASSSSKSNTQNRYSDDIDIEAQRPLSKDAMLPRAGTDTSYGSEGTVHRGSVLPWFLRPSMALLWPIVSIVLLLAFLIVSYLPVTDVLRGFLPMVPSIVDELGFSAGNFLYSFVPATLALLCVLVWLDVDMAYRRLQPFASLAQTTRRASAATSADVEKAAVSHRDDSLHGDSADSTLLTSYPASAFPLTPLQAIANSHYRVAYLSTITLLSCALPVLAGGCFWAQFDIPEQRVRIYVQLAGYYALTVFLVIYALSYLAAYPDKALRRNSSALGRVETFDDIRRLVSRSQILDDLVFHAPKSRVDVVTRLLAASPTPMLMAAQSKTSLKDSLRGFARARAAAEQNSRLSGGESTAEARYAFHRCVARDGGEWWGIDRVR